MWILLLVEFCNATTIAASFILKIPQILKLLQTGSTYGISFNGLIVEYLAHCIVFSYNWFQEYPIQSYLEYALLIIQDIILILIVLSSRGLLDVNRLGLLGCSIAIFCLLARGYPYGLITIIINFVIPIGASSKIMYIREVWKTRDSSNVSLPTWLIASFTSIARVITNGMKGDVPLLLHSSTSTILCSVMSISAVYFARVESKPVPEPLIKDADTEPAAGGDTLAGKKDK